MGHIYLQRRNLTKVYVDGVNTISYNYDEDYNLTSEVYANGQSIRYEYDDNNNLVRQYHNNDETAYLTFVYNADNELTLKTDTDTGLRYEYDGESYEVYRISDNTLVYSYSETVTEADEENDIEARTDITETHFGTTYSSTIKDKSVSYTTGNNTVEYSYTEDENQVNSDSVKYNNSNVITSSYDYDDNGNITEKAMNYQQSKTVTNVYNNKNLIQSTTVGNRVIDYTYDTNNQLVRCDDSLLNYTMKYYYNSRGNLSETRKFKYKQSTNSSLKYYLYHNSNPDELTYYNGTGYSYDDVGNMIHRDADDFAWSNGKNLVSYTENALDESIYHSFTYDENGIRTSKTVEGVTTYFNTKDGVILSQTDGTNTLIFQYDSTGTPLGFIWNGTQYFYLTNQMGDVIGITDNQGNELVQYEYNEWGSTSKITSVHNTSAERSLGNLNPLRYRGYYFDREFGLYYLQSRYYSPSIGRFISADAPEYVQMQKDDYAGINSYLYCCNDAVNNVDYNGAAYSPSKAKAYAEKWWNDTNSDYGRNSNGDCANFVSQCLYAGQLSKMTGGFKWGWHCYKERNVNVNGMPHTTYDRSHAWAAAQNLYDWLKKNNHVSATYTIRNRNDVDKVGKKLYSKAYCCAAIFFDWNNSKTHKGINHATLSGQIVNYKNLYDVYYYAHSSNRNGKRYDRNGNRQYTSIKDAYNQKDLKNMIVYVCILK